jgi:metal-responsive CopG/Arc/MetJ family transcriptional regulator
LADKRNKITVLLDKDEFQRFDSYCDKRGFKKSTLIVRLIREMLDKEGFRSRRDDSLRAPAGDMR